MIEWVLGFTAAISVINSIVNIIIIALIYGVLELED